MSMDFIKETDDYIIRNIVESDKFIPYSFEAIPMAVGVTLIVGILQDKSQIQNMLNPNSKTVQGVKFSKPEWTLEAAFEWLQTNQKNFDAVVKKEFAKKSLKNISGVEIFSAGTWNGDKYTVEDIDEMIRAYNDNSETMTPHLKLGHDKTQKLLQEDGMPAAGWIGKLYRKGEKLLADFVDIPKKVFELIENRAYKRVSSEIWVDPTINGKKYKYFLSAVSLLGADMPGVQNLKDILSRYRLEDNDAIRSYLESSSELKVNHYNISTDQLIEGEIPMSKTEREIQLEEQLRQAKEDAEKAQGEVKKFKSDADAANQLLKEESEKREAAEKESLEFKQIAKNTEIEKQVNELVAEKIITPGQKTYAQALLKDEADPETKKFTVKVGEKEESLSKFELIKKFASLSKSKSDVNLDERSLDGSDNAGSSTGPSVKEIEEYAQKHELTFSAAYKDVLAGKLKIPGDEK